MCTRLRGMSPFHHYSEAVQVAPRLPEGIDSPRHLIRQELTRNPWRLDRLRQQPILTGEGERYEYLMYLQIQSLYLLGPQKRKTCPLSGNFFEKFSLLPRNY